MSNKPLKKTVEQIRLKEADRRRARMERIAEMAREAIVLNPVLPTTLQRLKLEKTPRLAADQTKRKDWITWLKVAGFTAITCLIMVTAAYAGLDDQLKKSEELIYGWISKLIMGGSTIAGGAMAITKGNSLQGLAVAGAGIIIGGTLSLIRDGSILTAFSGASAQ